MGYCKILNHGLMQNIEIWDTAKYWIMGYCKILNYGILRNIKLWATAKYWILGYCKILNHGLLQNIEHLNFPYFFFKWYKVNLSLFTPWRRRGSKGVTPFILNFGARRRRMFDVTLRLFYLWQRHPVPTG
jgi:hypothetical protein